MVRRSTLNTGLVFLIVTAAVISLFSFTRLRSTRDLHQSHRIVEEPLTEEMAAIQLVRSTVAAHKVAVFSKTYCPYCAKAKAALSSHVKPESMFVMELDQRSDGDVIQDALLEVTGARSVPRVFINGQFIGGGDDTARKAQNGELKLLLEAAGVEVIA